MNPFDLAFEHRQQIIADALREAEQARRVRMASSEHPEPRVALRVLTLLQQQVKSLFFWKKASPQVELASFESCCIGSDIQGGQLCPCL